jgi:hypothetical protein
MDPFIPQLAKSSGLLQANTKKTIYAKEIKRN